MLDGSPVNSSNNVFSGAISDVTITVQKANPLNETSDLSIVSDTASTKKAIEDFVKAYNATLDELNKLTVNSETERGILATDSSTRSIINKLRNTVSETISSVAGSFQSLASLGVTSTKAGKLELKTSILDSAIATDITKVIELFSNTDGVANKVKSFIDQQITGNGVIPSREEGIKNELDRIFNERQSLSLRTGKLETRLRAQYAALDGLVSAMNGTSTFIAQNLTRIPNYNSSKSK